MVHANLGEPTNDSIAVLPANIGTFCFPLLLDQGAEPIAIWNNIGKVERVGSSKYFDGTSIPDPERAPVIFLELLGGDPVNLPVGTTVTFQAVITDPGSASSKGASVSNAVVLMIQ